MRPNPRLVCTAAAALAALLGGTAVVPGTDGVTSPVVRPAYAQDGTDGEDGEDGAHGKDGADGAAAPEAPRVAPTMDTAIEQVDGKRQVAIKLPKEWTVVPREERPKNELAVFQGPLTAQDNGAVLLFVEPEATRAVLALHGSLGGRGALLPDAMRSGPGWAEGCVVEVVGNPARTLYQRFVEKDGMVWSALVIGHAQSKDRMKEIATKILDSFRVTAKPPAPPSPPKEMSAKKAGPLDLWTDAAKEHEGKLGKALGFAEEARDIAAKSLKGKPFDESRPLVRAYGDGARFEDQAKPALGEAPEHAAYDPAGRAVWIRLFQADRDEFAWPVRYAAASQFVHQYFGGRPPVWVHDGLCAFAAATAEAGGKAGKLTPERIREVKSKAKADRGFDKWLDIRSYSEAPDPAANAAELLAWHFFIRHGPGKKYRKAYDASLDVLRATGDFTASRKAWDGTDFEAMKKEFGDFLLRLEP